MPIEKEYVLRRATKKANLLEVSLPVDWCKYQGVREGAKVKLFADGVVIIVPAGNEELEKKAKEMVENRR
jgi:hypothetical protein